MRELRAARNVSEVLAWRINRHLAAHSAVPADAGTAPNDTTMTKTNPPITPTQSTAPANEQDHASARHVVAIGPVATPLLPWVPRPRQVPTDGEAAPQPVPDGEPWEAQLARRGRPGQGRPERPHGTGPEPAARSDRGPLQQVLPRHDSPAIGRTPHR